MLAFRNTGEERFLKKHYPHLKIRAYPNITETYDAMKRGHGDAMIGSTAAIWVWLAENPDFEVRIPLLDKSSLIGPVVDKNNSSLLEWLNREMDAMRQDGRLRQIYERTLRPVYGEQVRVEDFLIL